ncbi:MAG: hypothetical protein IKW85_06670 [Muribaculaceae bacterium]|nr:hypothetical protein [Muribaculaceae bacterium]
MIKKPIGTGRPTGRIPKLRPAARPGWYKRFRRLVKLTGMPTKRPK